MEYLKKSTAPVAENDERIHATVKTMLARIETEGESAVREYAAQFDNWQGDFILSDAKRAELIAQVPEQTKQDIQFAYKQVKTFAEAQRASLTEFEIESEPGVKLGQKVIPVNCAGCYVPGGRYSHAASALMSIATAKVAGVETIVACSPPKDGSIHPAGAKLIWPFICK